MSFRELVTRVQSRSGFSNQKSKDALELMVESIAVRLDDKDRRLFALQLPEYLSDIALTVFPSTENTTSDLIEQFMSYERLEEGKARELFMVAWQALKIDIPERVLKQIISQLPRSSVALLG